MTDRLELGYVSRAHGLKGELSLKLSTDRTGERLAPGAVLYLNDDAFTVKASKPHGKKWLVHLHEVKGREAAEALQGRTITGDPLDPDDLDEGEFFIHEMFGLTVVDQHGVEHGKVTSVIDNPASDILELASGRLVPLNFYVSHDDHVVNVDVPVGLLDDGAEEAR